jgi:hypothetical protein
MKLKIIWTLLILINLLSCKNKIDESKLTNIPGSRILIEMPEGFKLTSGTMGIEKNKNSMVQFFDLIGGNHFNNSNTVSKEIFESKGIKVLENKDLKIDNYDAKYFVLQANENEKSINIVFGDSTFSDMVMAVYNIKDLKTEKDLKKALLSLKYDKKIKINPLDFALFKVNPNKSKFKFAKYNSNIFLFSENGKVKDAYDKEPMFTITSFTIDQTINTEAIAESLLQGMQQNGFYKTDEKNVSIENLNGYKAIRREIYGYMKAEYTLLYQVVIINKESLNAIAMQGISYSENEINLPEFIELSENIIYK